MNAEPVTLMGESPYQDPKRYSWIFSLLIPALTLLGPLLFMLTPSVVVLWVPIVVLYGVMPLLDWVLGVDQSNPPESAVAGLESDTYYRYITFALVPLLWGSFLFNAWFVGHFSAGGELAWYGVLPAGIVGGLVCGFGSNLGHELGHKKSRLERYLAKLVLAIGAYGHFTIEHNRGHHRDVATPADSASSRMGESIYRFALREIPGGLKRAWELEASRLRRQEKNAWSPHNEILQPALMSILVYALLIYLYGWVMLPFLAIVVFWGAWQLTSANYIEHYGLLRGREANGRYETCKPHHSWNSNHRFSNWALFHLQRHSDHHANPARRYQSLRHFDTVPQLPSGYFTMFLLAYVPALWFRIMDKRLLDHVDNNLSRINFSDESREKLCRRYSLIS